MRSLYASAQRPQVLRSPERLPGSNHPRCRQPATSPGDQPGPSGLVAGAAAQSCRVWMVFPSWPTHRAVERDPEQARRLARTRIA